MESGDLLTLIIVGAIAGVAASSLMGLRSKGKSSITDWIRDTIIGIVGAIVGGFLFDALDVSLPDILDTQISLANILVAFIGAIIVIFVVRLIRK